jgi:predicted RNA-binding Zn ribbon-like protein
MSQTTTKPKFELTGGHISLDLTNTVDNRTSGNPVDNLHSYEDLLAFAQQTGVIGSNDAQQLARAAVRNPKAAHKVLQETIAVREALFSIFSAITVEKQPPSSALDQLNQSLRQASAHRILSPGHGEFSWKLSAPNDALERVLWPFVLQGADLLASPDLAKVRECASETCGWLFLDKSKSHSRRWCDMKGCGNRDKARRFYQRQRSL